MHDNVLVKNTLVNCMQSDDSFSEI